MTSKGQSAAEYALVGGLVLLVSIPALGTLSSVFNSKLGQSTTSMGALQQSLASFSPATTGAGSGSGSGSVIGSTVSGTQTVTLDLGNGEKLTIPNFPTNSAQIIETAGASGVTDALASTLKQLATALAASGKITEADSQALIDLANQGSTMAGVIKVLESAPTAPDPKSVQVTYNSQTYSLYELRELINFAGTSQANWIQEGADPTYTTGAEVVKFTKLFHQVQSTPAMQNPLIQNLITNLATRIVTTSDEVDNFIYKSSVDGQDFRTNYVGLKNQLVQDDSTTICLTGGGSGTGVSCNG
jgi:hypothetical protein